MKRRRALEIIGVAAGAPLLAPGSAVAEALALGQRIRAVAGPVGGAPPATLTPAQARTVTALAETIIPRTDTPGASEAGVTAFVDALLTGWLDASDRDRFLAGLNGVDSLARSAHGAAFADCMSAQQAELVGRMDEDLDRHRRDPEIDETQTFLYDMKRFTLAGYFTSRPGLRSLGYRIIPGAFEGCVLLDQYGTGEGRPGGQP
ncbi:gluconate 2-dehydrogenase subunit 3 family protein [Candidatus Palauibacter polyketidifaciens]|uniref:gluconate 2-dehydrogenase subunit 3 family protein n=1 Tax=Candidatus Palauibacter polyketidifaciens TaxID=3056740 RepID=UPI0023982E0F|nr:gluconate 2-dehydrogenase subunit 3 family protein [Candidatus Palauibacter polyketidifaciens]MDE2720632.1 gluconate 2-dehydrogenase subunit 3 family protein [Candidatus Palauibacter polyketidifaciens]